MGNIRKMFKRGIIILLVFLELSTQISISQNEINSESALPLPPPITSTNQTGCFKTIGQCFRQSPKALAQCAFEHAINNMDCFIASNSTWQLNEYISLKKNTDWKPIELEARQHQTLFEMVFKKFSDLIASRSIQFNIPNDDDDVDDNNSGTSIEERKKSGFAGFNGFSDFGGSGKKKSDQTFNSFFSFKSK